MPMMRLKLTLHACVPPYILYMLCGCGGDLKDLLRCLYIFACQRCARGKCEKLSDARVHLNISTLLFSAYGTKHIHKSRKPSVPSLHLNICVVLHVRYAYTMGTIYQIAIKNE